MAAMNKSLAQINKSLDGPKRLRSEKAAPYAFLESNEATYGLRVPRDSFPTIASDVRLPASKLVIDGEVISADGQGHP
jgi:hypothetical protein